MLGRPFAQRNQDGRLEVFAIGLGGIFNIWQVFPNAGWRDGWLSMGRPSSNVGIRSHVVGTNADGRQEIFAVGDDNGLWQKWQFTALCGAKIPGALDEQLEKFSEDDDAVRELGVEYATRQVRELWDAGVPGVHFYVLNRSYSVSQILTNLGLQGHTAQLEE